jgi:hypothetical protein
MNMCEKLNLIINIYLSLAYMYQSLGILCLILLLHNAYDLLDIGLGTCLGIGLHHAHKSLAYKCQLPCIHWDQLLLRRGCGQGDKTLGTWLGIGIHQLQQGLKGVHIFQTFWKVHCVTKSLLFELETSNFGYLLIF